MSARERLERTIAAARAGQPRPERTALEHLLSVGRAAELSVGAGAMFLEDGDSVARALGIRVHRSAVAERGTMYAVKDHHGATTELIVGTRVDPLEVVRRDARRWVRDGMARAGMVPLRLRLEHAEQRRAEDYLDQLAGPLAWPA